MRTEEQIVADCEARMAEIEAEANRRKNDPLIQRPCKTCRWYRCGGVRFTSWGSCSQPLIIGFSGPRWMTGWNREIPKLCGPEKALWEPKRTFFEWLSDLFDRAGEFIKHG